MPSPRLAWRAPCESLRSIEALSGKIDAIRDGNAEALCLIQRWSMTARSRFDKQTVKVGWLDKIDREHAPINFIAFRKGMATRPG